MSVESAGADKIRIKAAQTVVSELGISDWYLPPWRDIPEKNQAMWLTLYKAGMR